MRSMVMSGSLVLDIQDFLWRTNPVNAAVVTAAVCLLIGLLFAEKKGQTDPILTFKTPLSALFVVAALIQPHAVPSYYHWVLAGLVWGLVGDVCLALKGKSAFRAGLVAFLLGHILYVVAFVGLTRLSDWLTPAHLIIAAASAGVFWWLRPHLGAMLVPVALYIIVISGMLAAAWVAFLNPDLPRGGAVTLLLGALCFYLSDLFVARDRFVRSEFANRALGLPLYYCGQFLIAFSVGLIS
jgi:uncharacterized membrane protein YhhN